MKKACVVAARRLSARPWPPRGVGGVLMSGTLLAGQCLAHGLQVAMGHWNALDQGYDCA
jgi:hypothetical protein